MTERYRHRQSNPLPIAFAFTAIVLTAVLVVLGGDAAAIVPTLIAGLVLTAFVSEFCFLTTVVTDDEIRASFLFGWPRRTIPVRAITAHGPIRNRWYHGWGVRIVPGGRMYNVWGLDAVLIEYDAGRPIVFRIGTDDPEGLDAAIAGARRDARGG